MVFFFQNLVNALQWGSFYALIALGYSMVYGILMLFNFAHGDIFMVGAYIGFGVATGLTALASMRCHCPAQLVDSGADHPYFHVSDLLCGHAGGKARLPASAGSPAGFGGHHRPDDRHHSGNRKSGPAGR